MEPMDAYRASRSEMGDPRLAAFGRQPRVRTSRGHRLGRQLRNLESGLGATLFERADGGTQPTAVEVEFLGSGGCIIEEVETIAIRSKNRARGESGRPTIGVHAAPIEHRRRFRGIRAALPHRRHL